MKIFSALLLVLITGLQGMTQNIQQLPKLKDGYGSEYRFVGEVKNGKPNGLGISYYPSNNTALYYVGYFTDGLYDGKGVILFGDGTFLSGIWKKGKLNGKGATLNKTGDLFVGDYVNGIKEGKGIYFYKDNSALIGNFKNDIFEGRNIFITAQGDIINDNFYQNGKKNGSGYQYETANKKLYEGLWQNGEWVSAQTASYNSFLKTPSLYGEKTESQILIGGIDADRHLRDTGYYYNLKTKKRYFGKFVKGKMASGLTIRDDSTRFVGSINDLGAVGSSSFYRIGNYYKEGVYKDDYLNDVNGLSIDLKRKTVYYGGYEAGFAKGKAFFVDIDKSLYVGEYVKGKFTGNGYRISPDGSFVKGSFLEGFPVTVTSMLDKEGKSVNLKPKSISEAITFLKDSYGVDFKNVRGSLILESDLLDNDEDVFDVIRTGLYQLPGATKNFMVEDMMGSYSYISHYFSSTDLNKAIAKYKNLGKLVQMATASKSKGTAPEKLEGEISEVDTDEPDIFSKFYFNDEDDTDDFSVSIVLKKVGDEYRVYLAQGSSEVLGLWLEGL